jgi:hypothetical protein
MGWGTLTFFVSHEVLDEDGGVAVLEVHDVEVAVVFVRSLGFVDEVVEEDGPDLDLGYVRMSFDITYFEGSARRLFGL